MQHRFVLSVVLCLAAIAVLGIAAAPSLAQAGCDCHTAVPPTNGAPAAPAPYVASVTDCTTCHVDWTVPPHPAARLGRLQLGADTGASGLVLHGWVASVKVPTPHSPGSGWVGHPGVVLYLQQRLWGATDFTDLTQVTTGAKGGFTFAVASPMPFAAYRAITQGHVGPLVGGGAGLFRPRVTTLLPTPELTLALHGHFDMGYITPASLKLGRGVTVKGTVKPADLGGTVTVRVQKRVAGEWRTRFTAQPSVSATGTYSWKFTPKSRGKFRVDASIYATAEHEAAATGFQPVFGWGWFKVV